MFCICNDTFYGCINEFFIICQVPVAVIASLDDGNFAENTLDKDLNSRWSARGGGQWIEYDLGDSYIVDGLDIAFYKGELRTATIDINISEDGENWTTL